MPLSGKFTITYADYDSEIGTVGYRGAALTPANFNAQDVLKDTLLVCTNAMQLGTRQKYEFGNVSLVSVDPGPEGAQRELKWLVSYHDVTSIKRYSIEIPCANVGLLDENDRAHAEIGDAGPVDAWVAAFEAYHLSPDGGVCVVDEITLVGRPI